MTCKNRFPIYNIGTYFELITVSFNYAFSTADVNAVSNDMVSMHTGILVECVSRGQSTEL